MAGNALLPCRDVLRRQGIRAAPQLLVLFTLLTSGLASGDEGSRSQARQAAGGVEAAATEVRNFVRANVGAGDDDLEGFKHTMSTE